MEEPLPLGSAQLLGIVQQRQRADAMVAQARVVEEHTGNDERPRERPAAGLVGDEIPLEGRIAAVADVFDALTTRRAYRAALPLDQAMGILRAGRGTQFDPRVLDAFFESLDEILAIRNQFGDGAAGEAETLRAVV